MMFKEKKKPENPNFVVGSVIADLDFFEKKDNRFYKRHFLKAYFNGEEMSQKEKELFSFHFVEDRQDAECY